MSGTFKWLSTSSERLQQVMEEIRYGSEPKTSFYVLLMSACLIASFGLIANSGAVVIGAMLVCPLMTPMLGIALSLVRAEPALLGRALRTEAIGVMLSIGIAALLGLFPLALQVNREMLALTEPTLLDLLVAGLAGFAGTYAMIDARLSPALPGVAIATSIMPPLANTGLCLAVGAYRGAWGSFILFLANFVTILLVSGATFVAAGISRNIDWHDKWQLVHRFGLAVAGFLLVTGLLTHTLVRIVQDRVLNNNLRRVITAELAQFPATSLTNLIYRENQNRLFVLATVRTPRIIAPDKVKAIQTALEDAIKQPAELIVRTVLAKDVSATGSSSQLAAQNLDSFFISGKLNPGVDRLQLAEQTLREILLNRPDLLLADVDLLQFPRGPVLLATLQGSRRLVPAEVKDMEKQVQQRLGDPNLRLLTRCLNTVDVDAQSRILYAWTHFGSQSPEKVALQARVQKAVAAELQKFPGLFVTNLDALREDDHWNVRVEAMGIQDITAKELARVEKEVSQQVRRDTRIYLWFRREAMVTGEGLTSVDDFIKRKMKERTLSP